MKLRILPWIFAGVLAIFSPPGQGELPNIIVKKFDNNIYHEKIYDISFIGIKHI